MKKVLHVVSSLKRNGTETFIMNIFRNINKEDVMFDFLIFDSSKDGYYQEAKELGAQITILPPRRKGILNYKKNLKKFFKENKGKYDVLHFHDMSFSSILSLYYAKRYGIPKIITHIHGSSCEGLHNKIFHSVNKYLITGIANNYLGCSHEACKWGYQLTPAFKKSQIIANGIDISKFTFDTTKREEIRKNYNISSEEIVLIHVGSFNPIKNHKFIIDILDKLHQKGVKPKLITIGRGDLEEAILNYVLEKNLQDFYIHVGEQKDISPFLSASDIFIFPSLHEGLGFVAIEAQANGLTTFVSTGVPEAIKVSPTLYRLDLHKGPEFWADQIMKTNIKTARKQPDDINKFSIDTTINQLSSIYLS